MNARQITSKYAPRPIGPYSQAILAGSFVFGAQIGIDCLSGTLVSADPLEQTDQVLRNIAAIVRDAGEQVAIVQLTVYIKDLSISERVLAAVARLGDIAVTIVGCAGLPLGAEIEIEFTAFVQIGMETRSTPVSV